MKDQSKKVASLKHKEQVEKSKNARLMEEARKREDNLSENSQQVKVRLACGYVCMRACVRAAFLDSVNPTERFTVASTALLAESITNYNLSNSNSCSEGHPTSEVWAHRGAGGGPERERSNHCGARDGAGTGGGCQITPGETGTQHPLNTHGHDKAILTSHRIEPYSW